MVNALTKVFQNNNIGALREKITDLEAQQTTLQERIDGNERRRADNALAATDGDAEAQAALGQANTDRFDLDLRLSDLNLALDQARRNLCAAEGRAADKARKGRADKINALLGAREKAAGEAEKHLANLTAVLGKMDGFSSEIVEMHKEFRPPHPSGLSGLGDPATLKPAANAERLNEAVHRIGLRQYFDPAFRRSPIQRQDWIDTKPDVGFAAGEAKTHRDYEVRDTPIKRASSEAA